VTFHAGSSPAVRVELRWTEGGKSLPCAHLIRRAPENGRLPATSDAEIEGDEAHRDAGVGSAIPLRVTDLPGFAILPGDRFVATVRLIVGAAGRIRRRGGGCAFAMLRSDQLFSDSTTNTGEPVGLHERVRRTPPAEPDAREVACGSKCISDGGASGSV
jgi:hypothetical protein